MSASDDASPRERCLALAIDLRDAFADEAHPAIACSLFPAAARPDDHSYVAARARVLDWVRKWESEITLTDDFHGLRPDHKLEPRRDSSLALFVLKHTDVPVLRPLGRPVCPQGAARNYEGGLLATPPTGSMDVAAMIRWREGGPRRVLVVADAWLGKTFVAKRLAEALVQAGIETRTTWLEGPPVSRRVRGSPHG